MKRYYKWKIYWWWKFRDWRYERVWRFNQGHPYDGYSIGPLELRRYLYDHKPR